VNPNEELTKTINSRVHAAVSPYGFRKSGSTFSRDVGEVIHLVTLQKSTSSGKTHVKFTVNVGAWIKALAPIRAGVPDKPDIWSAHWRVRLGELAPERSDRWWTVANSDEAVASGQAVAEMIVKLALPALDELSSVSTLIRLWRTGQAPGLTATERERYLTKLDGRAAS
jgi:hypothetical protein